MAWAISASSSASLSSLTTASVGASRLAADKGVPNRLTPDTLQLREPHVLKHRPDGAVRAVPVLPVLADLLRQHLREFGTAPDGRLFRGARGGMLSESTYGRVWRAARGIALGPELAAAPLARRPCDLRHAGLSLWLNATGVPAEVAARAGNSVRVLQAVYAHCIDGREQVIRRRSKMPSTLAPAPSMSHGA